MRCQLPDSSFFGVFNYNYYFNDNLNLRTSRYCPYSLPWAEKRAHFQGTRWGWGLQESLQFPQAIYSCWVPEHWHLGGEALSNTLSRSPLSSIKA